MQLDLTGNELCGINHRGEGTYTAEGITAIAEALKVTGSLTKLDLEYNQLDESAKAALRAAARPALKLDL